MAKDHTAVIGLMIAVYGAVVATINSIVQIITARRDRTDVVLKVRKNMTAVNFPRYAGITLTLVTATNRGKRPVNIQGFSTILLDSHDQWMLADTHPPIPHEITEGQDITAYIDEATLNRNLVECYYVWDSVGRTFRIHIAPWHRRVWSKLRRKFAPVQHVRR